MITRGLNGALVFLIVEMQFVLRMTSTVRLNVHVVSNSVLTACANCTHLVRVLCGTFGLRSATMKLPLSIGYQRKLSIVQNVIKLWRRMEDATWYSVYVDSHFGKTCEFEFFLYL